MKFVHSTDVHMKSDKQSSHVAKVGGERGRERDVARQMGQELFGGAGKNKQIAVAGA